MSHAEIRLPVEHVSDTAFLVALCRAQESARPDAKFHDRFASLLAEPKAAELEQKLPALREFDWVMTSRTCLIDRHIQQLMAGGVDTVINLAAGLDTRPYRMELPASLRWVEADFPEITAYKTERLRDEKPRCRLERAMLDLGDDEARRGLLRRLDITSRRSLVITEGLLMYLTQPQVDALARDLAAMRATRSWIMDYQPPEFFSWMQSRMDTESVDDSERKVSFGFMTEEGPEYFARFGWQLAAFDSFTQGAHEFGREIPDGWLPTEAADRRAFDRSGIALLSR
jgi:methyltransferase (TIGR00027 family)